MNKKKIVILSGLALIVLVLAIGAFNAFNKKAEVEVFKLDSSSSKGTVFAKGTCLSDITTSYILPFSITINKVLVKTGELVKKSQSLALVDSMQFKNALNELVLKKETEDLKLSKMNGSGSSKKEIDLQKKLVDYCKLKIDEFNNATKMINPENGEVLSLNDGTITYVGYGDGEIANSSKPIFQLSSSNIKIKAGIAEADISKVSPGMEVSISGEGFDGKISGTIDFVSNFSKTDIIDNTSTNTIDVYIKPDDNKMLKIGYNVDLEILENKQKDGLVIPMSAVRQDENGNSFIYILKNNIIKEASIKVLSYNGEDAVIESNLEDGNEIVIKSSEEIKDGQKVTKK